MTRKPNTKSPTERRLREEIRALMVSYAADTSRKNSDHIVREFLALIDDEVRRTRMSMMPIMNPRDDVAALVAKSIFPTPKSRKDWEADLTSEG